MSAFGRDPRTGASLVCPGCGSHCALGNRHCPECGRSLNDTGVVVDD